MEPTKNKKGEMTNNEMHNSALEIIDENDGEKKDVPSAKLSKIIAEEFDKELSFRQKQLEEVEEKICKAQKLLHLLRYVLITSYYNKKSLEYSSTNKESSTTPCLGTQNRIHPAVKKLLGKNASFDLINSRGKRKAHNKNNDNEASTSQSSITKKIKLEKKGFLEDTSKQKPVDNNPLRKRKTTRHRIVIGNISKWMPSLENDNTTHKWMVYVRSLEETLDISQVIKNVIFYLHPSYKPHDIVEVSTHPFHLSRRGWGEFPLRVQIFFKCPLNKPVSIIHNLKLDKTYTGRQTLGNETVVDLYLHDDFSLKQETSKETYQDIQTVKNTISGGVNKMSDCHTDTETVNVKIKSDLLINIEQQIVTVPNDFASSNFEHNYCYEGEVIREEISNIEPISVHNLSLLDHSYSLPYCEYDTLCSKNVGKNDNNVVIQQQDNTLIFGLDDSYVENQASYKTVTNENGIDPSKDKCVRTFTTASGQPIRFLPKSFNNVVLSNGTIIQINLLKQPPQSILKKIDLNTPLKQISPTHEKLIDYERYKLTLPKNCFKNLGEVLPYLFKRLPLWNDLANGNLDFKCTYPFVASSEREYISWNIGRRINSEWSRAKAIKKILSTENFPNLEKLNTKSLFMYARSHGYSPFFSFGTMFRKQSRELDLLRSCFSKSLPQKPFYLRTVDVDVDVTADIELDKDVTMSLEKSRLLDISDKTLISHCAFVKEAALDCGIILKSEEIYEGVVMNAAERMIFEAVRCFAEGLIRRSRHNLVCQKNFSKETSEITVEEIKVALNERSEIRSIMEFKKRKQEIDFFS